MNVSEFFEKLSFGELSGLHIGGEGVGYIRPEFHNRLVSHMNSVLSVMSARFSNNTHYVTLEMQEGVKTYSLEPQYAVSNVDPLNLAPRYIVDSVDEPFPDNVVKILAVHPAEDPEKSPTRALRLNETPVFAGIRMLNNKQFRIPDPVAGELLSVEYRASIPKIRIPVELTQEIVIIPSLLEALEFGVAAKVYRTMGGESNIGAALQLEQNMERVLAVVSGEDILHQTESTGFDKIADKGFI